MTALGLVIALVGPMAGAEQETAPEASAPTSGVAIFGERLLRYRQLPDGGGSGHFDPPLPVDDKVMLLAAMKALARAIYVDPRIGVDDMAAFDPRIGRVTKIGGLDFEYSFILDGTPRRGIEVILVRRKEVTRSIDEDALLKELEAL